MQNDVQLILNLVDTLSKAAESLTENKTLLTRNCALSSDNDALRYRVRQLEMQNVCLSEGVVAKELEKERKLRIELETRHTSAINYLQCRIGVLEAEVGANDDAYLELKKQNEQLTETLKAMSETEISDKTKAIIEKHKRVADALRLLEQEI